MNNLLIITAIIFLICIIVGAAQGFLKIAASLAATVLILAIGMFASPYVSRGILKMTPLESKVQEKCTEIFSLGGLGEIELPREQQMTVIENAKLPKVFRELLAENNNSEIYQTLGIHTFSEYIGSYLAKIIADFAAFLLTTLVVSIVVHIVMYIIGFISRLPVIGGINRAAGGILGIGMALVIVWLLFLVITLGYQTDIGQKCFENINDSRVLTYLYENNLLLNWGRR